MDRVSDNMTSETEERELTEETETQDVKKEIIKIEEYESKGIDTVECANNEELEHEVPSVGSCDSKKQSEEFKIEIQDVDEVDCNFKDNSALEGEEPVFFVDIKPLKFNEQYGCSDVPQFSVDRDLVDEISKENEEKLSNKKLKSNCCWNCGDNSHGLRECKLPRNHEEINRNRKAFMDNPKRIEFKRYHVEMSEKYSDLKPGIISDELREALGLSKDQLPCHIYAMRSLGYPPGWLLEAQTSSSTLEMYDNNGKRIPDPEDEEGEIESEHTKYDLDMIVEYPGFNVSPPMHTLDESYYYRAPSMNFRQNINAFVSSLKGSLVKNKRIIPLQGEELERRDKGVEDIEAEDMEAEDIPDTEPLPEDDCKFVPPLPTGLPPPPPPEPGVNMESDSPVNDGVYQPEDITPPAFSKQFEHFGKVKSVYVGTPVYSQHSPYTKLPSYDMFRKGMSEVINFDNLPESSGAFDKMSKLLRKVRHSLADNLSPKK